MMGKCCSNCNYFAKDACDGVTHKPSVFYFNKNKDSCTKWEEKEETSTRSCVPYIETVLMGVFTDEAKARYITEYFQQRVKESLDKSSTWIDNKEGGQYMFPQKFIDLLKNNSTGSA
jgi:hypothetical protein